jgi:hypothetical protein
VKFTVINNTDEIRKIIDKAVNDGRIKRWFGHSIMIQLYLYDYFIDRAEYFESRGRPHLEKIFKRTADKILFRIIRKIKRFSRWIDPEVFEALIYALEDLKH